MKVTQILLDMETMKLRGTGWRSQSISKPLTGERSSPATIFDQCLVRASAIYSIMLSGTETQRIMTLGTGGWTIPLSQLTRYSRPESLSQAMTWLLPDSHVVFEPLRWSCYSTVDLPCISQCFSPHRVAINSVRADKGMCAELAVWQTSAVIRFGCCGLAQFKRL